ncbi:hypothetical protein B0J18DRAFT_138294 [Chaetomium sp. MPI-SDFR-AT-0129]|nr:hypothetical protein B0J18DRAFT_138294 [Chaetomium sp. MPI-SDFR-AT-0129]
MHSNTKRTLVSNFNAYGNFDFYQQHVNGGLRARLSSPSVIVTVALVAVTIAYQTARQRRQLPSVLQILWDIVITLVPARLLFAIDQFLNPSPAHMLRTQQPRTRAAKSEALQRILGLNDGGGIIGSVSEAGRKGLSSLSSAAMGNNASFDTPPGLGNYDNSCYQNSILQGLASLKPFTPYLSAVSLERRPDLSPTRTTDALRELLAKLTSPSSNGRTIWTPKVLKNMSTFQQQDAQEYYSKLLDQIDNEIAKTARILADPPVFESSRLSFDSVGTNQSDDSGYESFHAHPKQGSNTRFSRNPLEGLMAQRVVCVNCGHCEGLTMIPFNCLTLTLGNLPEHDLYERLDQYTKVEPIEGVECLKCSLVMCRDVIKALIERAGESAMLRERLQVLEEALEEEAFDEETLTKKCKITSKSRTSSTKTKQVVLARPPSSLVFHVNRSGFNEQTGYMYKNSADVRFPMVLDLGPWCLGSKHGPLDLENNSIVQDMEQWILDPKASMVSGDREPSRIAGPIYELRAVVTHHGSHQNGHYICYRKHPFSSPPGMGKRAEAHGLSEANDTDLDGDIDLEESTPGHDVQQTQWWRLSDETVSIVDERTVLSQGGVFMLFYDCVDPNQDLVPDVDPVSNGIAASAAEIEALAASVSENDVCLTGELEVPMQHDNISPAPPSSAMPITTDTLSSGSRIGETIVERSPSPTHTHLLVRDSDMVEEAEMLETNGQALGPIFKPENVPIPDSPPQVPIADALEAAGA